MVPRNPTDYRLAPMGESWRVPTLSDFTDAEWTALSTERQQQIARHYAWVPEMPPRIFTAMKLPHHRVAGAAVVWRALVAAVARLDQTTLPSGDLDAVRAHLANHYKEFDRVAPWQRSAGLWQTFTTRRDANRATTDAALAALLRASDFHVEADALYLPEDRTMTSDREVRTIERPVHARAEPDGAPTTLQGYAALFDTPTTVGSFVEVIDRGAFDDALGDDVRVLFNHDPSLILGRTKSGTASIAVDAAGLRYQVTPPPTQVGRDVLALVERGDVDGSSFAFRVLADRWEPAPTATDLPVRHVEKVRLIDVSPVTHPAYAETTVEARGRAADLTTARADAVATTDRARARATEERRRRVAGHVAALD